MKRHLLFASMMLMGMGAFAQHLEKVPAGLTSNTVAVGEQLGAAEKTSKLSDTLRYYNSKTSQLDSSYVSYYDVVYPIDSGFIFGSNFKNDKAFAEQYDFAFKTDTSFNILGILACFDGKFNASNGATRNITINVWDRGAQVSAGTKKYLTGYPNTVLKSQQFNIKNIGMNNGNGVDTFKTFYFTSQLTGLKQAFYVGYSLPSYSWTSGLNGDSICIRSSYPNRGQRIGTYTVNTSLDTMITTRNAIQTSAGAWEDAYWIRGYIRNLSAIPVLRIQSSVSVNGLSHNGLTLFGNYPNPATDAINVKYALNRAADVNIYILDVAGHTISVTHETALAGEHVKSVSVSGLAAGNYLYMIRTSEGDAMAAQFTISK
jgi:hypothetical protein